jgi:hypothetical protein
MINLFRRPTESSFQIRSEERDRELDRELVVRIALALDGAVQATEAQKNGLRNRMDEVISIAAIVGGNEIDEYLTRDESRSKILLASDAEIKRGQARLETLGQHLSHFKFLKAALRSRFPDCQI